MTALRVIGEALVLLMLFVAGYAVLVVAAAAQS